MYLIRECSYNTENPVYMRISNEKKSMFIPEARVAKDYFNTGFYERCYIDWLLNNEIVKSDKNIIDIGAHIGWYTVSLADKCKHIYSFECSPKSFNYLCANIALNSIDYKVTKYNSALSGSVGTTKYYIRDKQDGGGNGISKFEYDNMQNVPSIDVPMNTLDSYELKDINFIKIDVEGHELEVLKGSVKTIKNNNYPKILFESWDNEREGFPIERLKQELFEFIISLGYKIIKLGVDTYLAYVEK